MNFTSFLSDSRHKFGALRGNRTYTLPENLNNPWPGLESYQDPITSSNKRMFCGREKESFEVTRMIDDNIFVTLYGRSGNGKTSLLNAGVFPKLRKMQYLPISVRLGTESSKKSFQKIIIQAIEDNVKAECRETIWVIPPIQDQSANEYLWTYFARTRFYADSQHEIPVFPVIVFDQFEEVYKKRTEEANELLRQISYLMDESHELESCEVDGQIYEYEYNFRFVVSIREDDLFLLEDSIDNNYLQAMKQTRYRLLPISKEGAKEVILSPAEKEGLFADNEKENIVGTIISISQGNGDTISANVLSLICNRIYVHYYERQGGQGHISLKLVEEFVSENPLEKFYFEATKHLSRKQRTYLEDNLVDISERRGSVSKDNFDHLFKKSGDSLLSGPLKILQESNGRVELIHDSFCQVLLDQKSKRMERWRTIVEHICLMVVCFIICYMVSESELYTINLESKTLLQSIFITILDLPFMWAIFLFNVIGAIRRSIPIMFIWISAIIVLCPPIADIFIFKDDPTQLPQTFYLLDILLIAFLFMTIWRRIYRSKVDKEANRQTFFTILDTTSLRLWLFVYIFYYLYFTIYILGEYLNIPETTYIFYIVLLPALFFSVFESKNHGNDWSLILGIMMPISFMLYCTSDITLFDFTISGIRLWITAIVFCFGTLIYVFWILIDEADNKLKVIIWELIFWGVLIGFYCLLYQYKFAMLIAWLVLFYGWQMLAESFKIEYFATFLFTIFLFVFLKGYAPTIKGVNVAEQANNWQWNNVISYDGKSYQLLDALTGKDLLGLKFKKQEDRNKLLLPLPDSVKIDYSINSAMFKIPGDNHELVYIVNPEFESHISARADKGRLVSLTLIKNRQRLFDRLSEKKTMTEKDEEIQRGQKQLLSMEQEKITEILNSGNDSIVKKNLSRQLCKGMSCNMLVNCLGKDSSIKDFSFFSHLTAFLYYVDSYYFENLHGYPNSDWDGDFDQMMQLYIEYLEDRKEKPRDQYLQNVVPLLIDYYNQTSDYGLKVLLYSKIVRLQQVAILYGLGRNAWAHTPLSSPVGVDIKSYYKKHL